MRYGPAFLFLSVLVLSAKTGAVDIPSFSEQTNTAGLGFLHQTDLALTSEGQMMSSGVGVGDVNRDGYLDIFVQNGNGYNAKLFINNGDGTFTDQASAWNINTAGLDGSAVSIIDIDNNGYPDIYAGGLVSSLPAFPNQVYLNSGNNNFVETGAASGADVTYGTYGTTFGDIDLDGDLDLVVADWGGFNLSISFTSMFTNNGSGVFTNVTGVNVDFDNGAKLWGFSPTLVDLNNDRYPDLPLAADFGTSQYHANNGDGTFTRLMGNGTTTDENGMGSAFGDYDNDGDLDWFVTSIFDDDGTVEGNWGTTGNRLYRNDGNHQFTDVTDVAGVRNGYWGWGASFADFNHDGLLDLVMTNGFILSSGSNPDPTFESDPDRLWLNTGDFTTGPTYTEASVQAGLAHVGDGKGLVALDSDNDGDLDIVTTTNLGALIYFRNEYNPAPDRWLQVELFAPAGNAPDGIGATIDVTVNGTSYHRAVISSPGFMGQQPLRAHFGFPAAAMIDSVVVNWPDGTQKVLSNVSPGQVLRINSGDINQNDKVDIADYLLAIRMILGLKSVTANELVRVDMNQSGVLDAGDLLLLLRKII